MNHVRNRGFTLVELMLAMSFIALLLIAVSVTTVQISRIYNKGITLREVNQVGRSISEELQRSIAASAPFDANAASDTAKYIVRPGGGRLCLGRYTFAWNYGAALEGGTGAPAIFNNYDDGQPIRFAKVADPSSSLCIDPTLAIQRAQATELLTAGDRDLVLHKFNVTEGAKDAVTEQALYAISMTIGTNEKEQLTTNNASCKPPAEGAGGEDYCAVNQFDIIARSGSTSGGE